MYDGRFLRREAEHGRGAMGKGALEKVASLPIAATTAVAEIGPTQGTAMSRRQAGLAAGVRFDVAGPRSTPKTGQSIDT
jgi:hypothetical protein